MQRLSLIILALIAAVSIGFAVYEFNAARDANTALAALDKEREDLRQKLWDAEKRKNELADQLAATSVGEEMPSATAQDGTNRERGSDGQTADSRDRRSRGGDPATGGFTRAMSFLDNPEMQQLIGVQQKAQLDARYGQLFKALNLNPQQVEQLKSLLVERQNSARDVLAAAASQGLNFRENRDEIQALLQQSNADIENNIHSLLGDTAYQQYQQYQQTLPQRNVVDQLANRLNYTSTPLSGAQADQLVGILAANAPPRNKESGSQRGGDGNGFFFGGGRGGGDFGGGAALVGMATTMGGGGLGGGQTAPITTAAVSQAQGILTPPQLAALQQLQAEQQAQQKMAQIMRTAIEGQRSQRTGGNQQTGGQATGGGTTPPASGATTGGARTTRRPGD